MDPAHICHLEQRAGSGGPGATVRRSDSIHRQRGMARVDRLRVEEWELVTALEVFAKRS